MAQTFRIILYPGATPVCEKLALLACKSNSQEVFQTNWAKLQRILEAEKKQTEWASYDDFKFKVHLLGDILLLIQKSEILE